MIINRLKFTLHYPLCTFVITFVSFVVKKNLTTKASKDVTKEHKGKNNSEAPCYPALF